MTDTPAVGGHRSAVVVGAGPVGLASALALRAEGVSPTVLEANPEDSTRPGSRAIYLHRETLGHLEAMHPGLGWELAGAGLVWTTKRTLWRGREVYLRTYPPLDPTVLPPFTSLAQAETERLLVDACKQAGIEVVWDATVAEVTPGPEGVALRTEQGGAWTADYVLGADGARSAVRTALGITMEGARSESSFVIVDLEERPEAPLALERTFHYHHPKVGGRNVLRVPFTGGWRVDLQCREDDDPGAFADPDQVGAWIDLVMPPGYAERVAWVSTYRFLQVVANAFVDPSARVLLVGESAHLFAPFGARGMNSGVVDAAAAAAAVRRALQAPGPGAAREAIADFEAQRREAAIYNREAAGAALTHMQAGDPLMRAKRRVAAVVALAGKRAGTWLDSAPYGPRGGSSRSGPGRY